MTGKCPDGDQTIAMPLLWALSGPDAPKYINRAGTEVRGEINEEKAKLQFRFTPVP
jgi:hypothetical protein